MSFRFGSKLGFAVVGFVIIATGFLVIFWMPTDAGAESKAADFARPLATLNYTANSRRDYMTGIRNGSSDKIDDSYIAALTKLDTDFDATIAGSDNALSQQQSQLHNLVSMHARQEIESTIDDFRNQIEAAKKNQISNLGLLIYARDLQIKAPAETLADYRARVDFYKSEVVYLDKYKKLSTEVCPQLSSVFAAEIAFWGDQVDFKNSSNSVDILNKLNSDMDKRLAIIKQAHAYDTDKFLPN